METKMYMNVETGSVDDYDGWWYEDETGTEVNGVDLGEVVEVEIVFDEDADFTNRVLPIRGFHDAASGDEYDAEFDAMGHIKETDQKVVISWLHPFIKGQEPEDLGEIDWDTNMRIRPKV